MTLIAKVKAKCSLSSSKISRNSDLIRNWVLLCEMLCYKCNKQCFKGVKLKKDIQKLAFMGNGAKEDQNQDMYGALEKNKKQVI